MLFIFGQRHLVSGHFSGHPAVPTPTHGVEWNDKKVFMNEKKVFSKSAPLPIAVLRSCTGSRICAICIPSQPSIDYIFSGSDDGTLASWNIATRRQVASIPAHSGSILEIQSVKDLVITQGRDGFISIRKHDCTNLATEAIRTLFTGSLTFCQISIVDVQDNFRSFFIVSPSEDSSVVSVWDALHGDLKASLSPSQKHSVGMLMCCRGICIQTEDFASPERDFLASQGELESANVPFRNNVEEPPVVVVAGYENGSIIVFHDSIKVSEKLYYTLPKILQELTRKGYTFKAIS